MLKTQLGASSSGTPAGVLIGAEPANETEAELLRMRAQNEALKNQVETLNHVQAKLVAKSKRYRDMQKDHLESQLGIYRPGEVPTEEQLAARQASRESTRNKDGALGGK